MPTPTPTATAAVDYRIWNMEFTQVVQCLDPSKGAADCADNNIPLVKDKVTVVRVYPQVQVLSGNFAGANLNARLFIDSPIQASPVQVAALNGPIYVKPGVPQRTDVNASLNYRLPLEWTAYDSIQLHIEINLDHALPETNYANNRRDMTLTFNPRRELSVLYVPVGYAPPGVAPITPSDRIRTAYHYVERLFPLPQGGLRYYRGATKWYHKPLDTVPQEIAFVKWLAKLYWHSDLLGATESYDQLVGWVAESTAAHHTAANIGWSDPLWDAPPGQGRATFVMDGWYGGESMAHELAHNLGRRHPNTADACDAWDGATDWPYGNATIQEEGFDPFANGGRGAVKVGAAKKDLMSYCIDWNAQSVAPIWLSPFTYRRLYEANSQPSLRRAAGQTQEVLIASGMISKAGSATLDPLFRLSSASVLPAPPTGTGYCLELQNGSGQVLSSVCFDADFLDYEGHPVDEEGFFYTMPFPADTQRVVLLHGTTVLAVHAASAHAPVVTLTAPTAGAAWDGTQTIRWTATDADGDPLEFSLVYSHDGGANWLPIDAEVTGDSYTLDTTEFPGGNQVHIRLLASDGFNTTSADVGPFSVPRKGPRPVILEPVDGARLSPPGSPLLLVGGGDDLEDGSLPSWAFSWSSDRDGPLGTSTGRELEIQGLSQGTHHLTLTARDSDGNTGQETITVYVQPWTDYLPLLLRSGGTPGWSTPTATRTQTRRPPTPTPTASPQAQGIYGRITYHDAAAAGISLALRFYDGSTWSTASTTTTDSDGRYLLTGAPSLSAGQEYYVRYGPNDTTPSYLYVWYGPPIDSYTSGARVSGGDWDIANVSLLSPENNVTLPLPITFSWQRREVATDTYRFRLFDPDSDQAWISNDLGYVGAASMTGLPEGAQYGKGYGWDVRVYNGPASYGLTYYWRGIAFAASGVAALERELIPVLPDAERDLAGRSRPARAEGK